METSNTCRKCEKTASTVCVACPYCGTFAPEPTEMPSSFVNAIDAIFGPVPDDVLSWDEVIIPYVEHPEFARRARETFQESALELDEECLKAIVDRFLLTASFLHDFGDFFKGGHNLSDKACLSHLHNSACTQVIYNVKTYGYPGEATVKKVMEIFRDSQ